MERIIERWRLYSPPVYTGIVVFVGVAFGLTQHLAALTGGNVSGGEVQAIAAHLSWHSIWGNQLFAPYFILLRLIHYGSQTPFYSRLAAASFGLIAVALVYFTLQRWVGWRLSTLGTALFGTSSALLYASRLIDPLVMQLLAVSFILAWYAWSHRYPQPRHLWAWVVGAGLLAYVPGVVLLFAVTCWLSRQSIKVAWLEANKKQRVGLSAVGLILGAPLIYFLATHGVHTVLLWLGYGLPVSTAAITDILHNVLLVPLHIFVRGSGNTATSMSHQPLISAAVGFLALLGTYVAIRRFHEGRWRLVVALLVSCYLLALLNGVTLAIFAPLLYVLAAIGLAYLLSEWYQVFPRNPIARSLGMGLIITLIAIIGWYELRAYFVAWPHTTTARASYVCAPASLSEAHCNLVQ